MARVIGCLLFIIILSGCEQEQPPSRVVVSYCSEVVPLADAPQQNVEEYQWYVDRVGVKKLWDAGYSGEGVDIAILDDALDIRHKDLRDNILPGYSRNYLEPVFSDLRFDPMAVDCQEDGHGTAVAGIIAAADNNIGVKGVAYDSKIFLANYLATQTDSDLRLALAGGYLSDATAVSSNSWGGAATSRLRRSDSIIDSAIGYQLETGFDGTGISYVFAAGNSRDINPNTVDGTVDTNSSDMATYEGLLNQPGIIAVCAVNEGSTYASYSNPGSNLWICGPSGDHTQHLNASLREDDERFLKLYPRGLATTDLSGFAGYNQPARRPPPGSQISFTHHLNFGWGGFYYNTDTSRVAANSNDGIELYRQKGNSDYTRFFSGTSAATPVVSGVIALLRAEHPELTWRDIKLILAESAEKVDPSSDWQDTVAAYHNPSDRYHHSINYGFGLVDAAAAMDLARGWVSLPEQEAIHSIQGGRIGLNRRSNAGSISISATDTDIDFIEYIQVYTQSDYPDFGDLTISLTSPTGTNSIFSLPHACLEWDEDFSVGEATDDCPDLTGGFTFGSAAHLGETPTGSWQLSIIGVKFQTHLDWRLIIHGFKK